MAPKTKIDYGLIEPDWRAGIKTERQMADEYTKTTGITVTSSGIHRHFTKLKIPRDLSAKIAERTKLIVSKAIVSSDSQQDSQQNATSPTESQIIEVNAQFQAQVLMSHRSDIQRLRKLACVLIEEVELQTGYQSDLHELAEVVIKARVIQDGLVTTDDVRRMKKMEEMFDLVLSSPQRIDSIKKLADVFKALIPLERQAIGLKDDEVPKPGNDVPEGTITKITRHIVDHRRTETTEQIVTVVPAKKEAA